MAWSNSKRGNSKKSAYYAGLRKGKKIGYANAKKYSKSGRRKSKW